MKTKIKIKLVNQDNIPYDNMAFEVRPFRINNNNSSPSIIRDITDSEGECIISLSPSWYPYRLSYTPNDTSNTYPVVVDFMVVESESIVDWDLLKVDSFNLDPFTPAGTILRKAIKTNVRATDLYKEIDSAYQDKKEEIDNYNNSVYLSNISELANLVQTLSTMVSALANDKTHVLDKLIEHQELYANLTQTHSDMIGIASDYMIAKTMGAINLGGHYLWFDSNDKLRFKKGVPVDEFDGTSIN